MHTFLSSTASIVSETGFCCGFIMGLLPCRITSSLISKKLSHSIQKKQLRPKIEHIPTSRISTYSKNYQWSSLLNGPSHRTFPKCQFHESAEWRRRLSSFANMRRHFRVYPARLERRPKWFYLHGVVRLPTRPAIFAFCRMKWFRWYRIPVQLGFQKGSIKVPSFYLK